MVPDSFYFHRSFSPINANLLIEWVNSVGTNEVMTQCSMGYLLLSLLTLPLLPFVLKFIR